MHLVYTEQRGSGYANDQEQVTFHLKEEADLHRHTGSWQIPVAWYLSVWSCLQQEERTGHDLIKLATLIRVLRDVTYPSELAVWHCRPRSHQRRFFLLCCSAWWWRLEPEDWPGNLPEERKERRFVFLSSVWATAHIENIQERKKAEMSTDFWSFTSLLQNKTLKDTNLKKHYQHFLTFS